MPKNKRTRKQKILSDMRKQHTAVPEISVSSEANIVLSAAETKNNFPLQPVQKASRPITISTSAYAYLSRDLTKTLLLTTSIVILELALHYILNWESWVLR